MILIDLFNKIKFNDIWNIIKTKHPLFLSDSFKELDETEKNVVLSNAYNDIKKCFISMQKKKCFLDDNIFIIVVAETDPDDMKKERIVSYLIERDDILAKKENISIWNGDKEDVKRFGYNFILWEEILGYNVCPESLSRISYKEIIAEIFCEMTRFGFNEEKIKNMGNNISNELDGLVIQEELESSRRRNLKDTWFDNLCDKIGISKRPKEYYGEATEQRIIVKNNHLIHIEYLKSVIDVDKNID